MSSDRPGGDDLLGADEALEQTDNRPTESDPDETVTQDPNWRPESEDS